MCHEPVDHSTRAQRRHVLIALNAEPELPRAAACTLARELDLWWRPGALERPSRPTAARLGLGPVHLKTALRTARHAAALAAAEEERAANAGAEILALGEPAYPAALLDLELAPPALYLRGSIPDRPMVALVGSRAADPYGLEIATLFSRKLAEHGVCVVSGFARGIDTAGHQGALEAREGRTVAVLGCGIDVDYPRRSRRLARRIAQSGALITEFPLGSTPYPSNFPIRNCTVAL